MDLNDFLMNWEAEEGGGGGPSDAGQAVGHHQSQHSDHSWRWDPVLLPPPDVPETARAEDRKPAARETASLMSHSAIGTNSAASVSASNTSGGNASGHASSSNSGVSAASASAGATSTTASSVDAAAAHAAQHAAAYFLNQGHIHPLAMTSMASCPPYKFVNLLPGDRSGVAHQAASPAPGQALPMMASAPAPQPFVQQQPAQPQNGAGFSFPANGNVDPNNQNAAFASHLSELAANFQNSSAAAATSIHGHVPAPLHFGMTVNGFHPQVNAQSNPVLPLPAFPGNLMGIESGVAPDAAAADTKPAAGNDAGKGAASAPPRRATASPNRQSNAIAVSTAAVSTHQKNSRDRNEREQVRAKKITQLITELRENMQKGGWKEEMKSKYQTLSQCRDYMEHLQRSHAAKERDIEQTKKLVKEQREKTQLLEARACANRLGGADHDPESVTSSLTDSTARSTSSSNEMDCSSSSSGDSLEKGTTKKRKSGDMANDGDDKAARQSNKKSRKSSSRGKKRQAKPDSAAAHAVGGESSAETSSMSEEDDGGNDSPGGKNISFDKTSSSVSDMTDSNRSSSVGAKGGGDGGEGSTSSISSTAAVVRGVGSSQNTGPSRRRRRQRGLSAIKEEGGGTKELVGHTAAGAAGKKPAVHKKRRGFHYNYQEVFLKSNVPQLIATLSGRIVVWNEFFLKATGLSERDAKRLTIFSIVQANQLSNLYKMVARALAENPKSTATAGSTSGPTESTGESSAAKSDHTDDEEWQAITLKCIPFPAHGGKNDGDEAKKTHHPNPLYITVALMEDENRDQRCFHCILTDSPHTNGKLGSVTPELFALLFTPDAKKAVEADAMAKKEIAM